MKIIFLGTGCIIPQKNRLPSSYLVENNKTKILVDIGPGIFVRLYEKTTNPFNLDYIFLTHFHQDHIADLWPYLFGRIWAKKYFKQVKKLKIIAHENFIDLWEKKKRETDLWLEKVQDVEIIPFTGEMITEFNGLNKINRINEIKIQSFKMNHKEESLGYKIFFGTKTIAFSGDTGNTGDTGYAGDIDEDDMLFKLFNNVDIGVTECSFTNENVIDWHLYPAAIERLVKNINISELYLSHFYPGTAESKDIKDLISKFPNIKKAYDGLEIEIEERRARSEGRKKK